MSDTELAIRTDPKTGQPFNTKKECEEYIKADGLREKGFQPRKWQGGWAAEGPAQLPASVEPTANKPAPAEEIKAEPEKSKYVKVVFQPQYGDNDTQQVPLIYRGIIMYANRGVEVILPRKMLEQCIDHAQHPTYVSTPSGHRPAGIKRLYHYQMLGPATEDEWTAFRLKSRQTQAEEFQRKGMTMPDTQVVPI